MKFIRGCGVYQAWWCSLLEGVVFTRRGGVVY